MVADVTEGKDKPASQKKCSSLLFVKPNKKYIFGLVATKALILFLYTKSSDLLPISSVSPSVHVNNVNLTLYNVTIFHIPLTEQKDMLPFYIEIARDEWCFISGIDLKASRTLKHCKCLKKWYGTDCGIPEAVWKSSYLQQGQKQGVEIRRRKRPRRIIRSVLFLGEFDLFDIVVHDSFQAIDVFIVPEEKYEDPPPLLRRLKNGFLPEFQNKVMPITVRNSSKEFVNAKEWSLYMFKNLWVEAWKRVVDFRPDDLFLYSHVSSVLSKDVLMFLKLYDGYPEPFHFALKPLLYNFRNLITNHSLTEKVALFEPIGCTFEYLNFICKNNVVNFLTNECATGAKTKVHFEHNFWKVESWVIGSRDSFGGWQCNWCMKAHELQQVFRSHNFLFKNFNVTNMSNNATAMLMKSGKWFDGSNVAIKMSESDFYFSPDALLSDPYKYSFLADRSPV